MFLYEAAECLFEEMHSNHQFQFKNFLNSNIENHFNMLNLNFQNNSLTKNNTLSSPIHNISKKTNGSLGLLPQQSTLPTNKQRNSLSNSVIGTRLYNFQNTIQQSRTQSNDLNTGDPSSIIPLSSSQIQQSKQELITTIPVNIVIGEPSKTAQTKSSIIDIPRILPSFLTSYTSSNQNEVGSSRFNMLSKRTSRLKNSKAIKFMNTMKLKSASIKKALFNQAIITSTNSETNITSASKEIITEKKNPILTAVSVSESTSSSTSSATESNKNHNDITGSASHLILPTIKLNDQEYINSDSNIADSSPSKEKVNL